MKAIGFTDETLAKPQIGIAPCWIGTMPCNWNHRELAAFVAERVREEGGSPIEATPSRSTTESPPAPKA
jgi:dihydroxy-acid dehydratase